MDLRRVVTAEEGCPAACADDDGRRLDHSDERHHRRASSEDPCAACGRQLPPGFFALGWALRRVEEAQSGEELEDPGEEGEEDPDDRCTTKPRNPRHSDTIGGGGNSLSNNQDGELPKKL